MTSAGFGQLHAGRAGDPVGEQRLTNGARALAGLFVGQQRFEVGHPQRGQPGAQLRRGQRLVPELAGDVGCGARGGGTPAALPFVGLAPSGSRCCTARTAPRCAARRRRAPARVGVLTGVGLEIFVERRPFGCSSLGGNSCSSVSSPLTTSSARFCCIVMTRLAA